MWEADETVVVTRKVNFTQSDISGVYWLVGTYRQEQIATMDKCANGPGLIEITPAGIARLSHLGFPICQLSIPARWQGLSSPARSESRTADSAKSVLAATGA
jgi:hypothetical protein